MRNRGTCFLARLLPAAFVTPITSFAQSTSQDRKSNSVAFIKTIIIRWSFFVFCGKVDLNHSEKNGKISALDQYQNAAFAPQKRCFKFIFHHQIFLSHSIVHYVSLCILYPILDYYILHIANIMRFQYQYIAIICGLKIHFLPTLTHFILFPDRILITLFSPALCTFYLHRVFPDTPCAHSPLPLRVFQSFRAY